MFVERKRAGRNQAEADALEIAFDTKALRALCEREDQAIGELGPDVAKALRNRLADLHAVSSPMGLVAGKPRVVDGSVPPERMMVDLTDGQVLVFTANHAKNPVGPTGNVDWANVSRVKVLHIGPIDV